MKISQLFKIYQDLLNTHISVQGWIQTARTQKNDIFVKLNDGTHPEGIQLIIDTQHFPDISLTTGTSIRVEGILIKSPAAGQLFELTVSKIDILGKCDPMEYPLSKNKMNLDTLRQYCHFRSRTSTFGSVFRIKSAISHSTHQFMRESGFLHLDPNIMTINECEGGAGVFQVTEKDISVPSKLPLTIVDTSTIEDGKKIKSSQITDKYDWKQDHFGQPVFLTVSSQLSLEPLACALGSVYTMNKSFRSEHSCTNKHLSEFTHFELETCFVDNSDLMTIGEDFIKYIASYLLRECKEDVENLDKFISKGLKERIQTIVNCKFYRVSYKDAIELAISNGKNIKYGDDLSSEIENFLTDFYKGPVFVFNWPIAIKSFYMKQDEVDTTLCNNFDLLMPYKVGELIGGSMREDCYDKLMFMLKKKGINPEPLKFYTDLRKFGSVPHGGFGLGFDRLTMLFTGMENIRDTVPFPVSYKSCDF
jgi:asparaginyl-tRNA synthetase